MNFVAIQMLLGDRAKYLGLIFAVAFSTFLMSHQSSIFAGIMNRTTSQIMDVPDANLWVMDRKTQYVDEVKALADDDLYRVRGVSGIEWAVPLFKGTPREGIRWHLPRRHHDGCRRCNAGRCVSKHGAGIDRRSASAPGHHHRL